MSTKILLRQNSNTISNKTAT